MHRFVIAALAVTECIIHDDESARHIRRSYIIIFEFSIALAENWCWRNQNHYHLIQPTVWTFSLPVFLRIYSCACEERSALIVNPFVYTLIMKYAGWAGWRMLTRMVLFTLQCVTQSVVERQIISDFHQSHFSCKDLITETPMNVIGIQLRGIRMKRFSSFHNIKTTSVYWSGPCIMSNESYDRGWSCIVHLTFVQLLLNSSLQRTCSCRQLALIYTLRCGSFGRSSWTG